ncbi:bifunctional diguanylate cyclase/phosphodiesterase [Paraburkholderia solisilvae]|nr:bifunctional diguanylate cyclase/phosphodiesterase [Paraburkholderia solisilvae]
MTELFDLPAAVMHITSGDPGWYEYCVTERALGSAFLRTVFDESPSTRRFGERPVFINDSDGIWQAPAGVLPGAERWIRFCACVPLRMSGDAMTGYLWLFDSRLRVDIEALENTRLADAATLLVARFQALDAFRYRDRLTLLGNRTQFVRDVRARMQGRDASNGGTHAVVVDIGSLPMVSRMVVALGLSKVEHSIQSMTARLTAALPPEIRLYKIGHARFGFLHAGGIDMARRLALRCTTCFEQPLALRDEFPIALSAHAGIVNIDDAGSAEDVVAALFAVSEQARAAGKAWLMYDRSIVAAQQRAFTIVNSMRAALCSPDQLRLVYQPRERLSDGAWVAAEALIRWRHPQLGDLSPSEILPLIEATSLMSMLTDWVIDAAARQLAQWHRMVPNFQMSINISPSDFGKTAFVDALCAALARHGAKGAGMEVEITETAVAADPEHAQRMLQRLKQVGISVAIDDFGVGYSSLSRWQTFSFGMLKVDGALTRDAAENERAEAIFQWVVALAKKLGQKVVAEGIETEAQRLAAARWGCDEAQGFLISRPLEASVLTARLAAATHRSMDGLPVMRSTSQSRSERHATSGFADFILLGLARLRHAIAACVRSR